MNGGEREHKTRAAEPFDVVVGVPSNVMSSDGLMSMIEFTSLPPPRLARRSGTKRVVRPMLKIITRESPLNRYIRF
jgi:hypothetical protein